jgi:hypothetical protein
MFIKLINELSSSSTSLANSLKKAVVTEMTQFPDEYTNNFPSKNRFLEFLSSEDIDFNSPAVTNSVCVAIASALKSVVIYLFPESTEKIHVVISVFHEKNFQLYYNCF